MPKPSKYETYRVTVTRLDSMLVKDIRNLILDAFQARQISAKVELVRKGETEAPKSFWQRIFG